VSSIVASVLSFSCPTDEPARTTQLVGTKGWMRLVAKILSCRGFFATDCLQNWWGSLVHVNLATDVFGAQSGRTTNLTLEIPGRCLKRTSIGLIASIGFVSCLRFAAGQVMGRTPNNMGEFGFISRKISIWRRDFEVFELDCRRNRRTSILLGPHTAWGCSCTNVYACL